MANDPFDLFTPKTTGYGKSGLNSYNKGEKLDYQRGVSALLRKFFFPSNRTPETSNLTKENVELIMEIIGEIVSAKVNKYDPLDRFDEEKFRRKLTQARYAGKLTSDDADDAWRIWKNYKTR